MQKTALLLGATGLVGSHLLQFLLSADYYQKVRVLVRRPLPIEHPKLEQIIFDFDHPEAQKVVGEEVFCCLGTTLKKAGSEAAQFKIDHDYPLQIGQIALKNGARKYFLVSSIGADAASRNFYLRTKGSLEKGLAALHFENFVSFRPSILFGGRAEFRFGERVGIFLMRLVAPFLFGKWKKYRGIEARVVASAMFRVAQAAQHGNRTLESDEIQRLGCDA